MLWGTVKVNSGSEKHPMPVDRSVGALDGSDFNGIDGGGLSTWLEPLK